MTVVARSARRVRMPATLLAGIVVVAALATACGADRWSGTWANPKTGEQIVLTRTGDGAYAMTSPTSSRTGASVPFVVNGDSLQMAGTAGLVSQMIVLKRDGDTLVFRRGTVTTEFVRR